MGVRAPSCTHLAARYKNTMPNSSIPLVLSYFKLNFRFGFRRFKYIETSPQREKTDRSWGMKGIVANRPFGGGDLEETGATGVVMRASKGRPRDRAGFQTFGSQDHELWKKRTSRLVEYVIARPKPC